MGTNYYAHLNACNACGKPEYKFHIGKSSFGWTFSFYAVSEIAESWAQWKVILQNPDTRIVDEYGEVVTFDRFKNIVEKRSHPSGTLLNHAENYPHESNFLDSEGYSFSRYEFS